MEVCVKMGESNPASSKRTVTVVMIGVALLVIYTLWSGSALKSVSVPGFKAEFERGGMNSGKPAKEVNSDDIMQHQKELEQKVRDTEDELGGAGGQSQSTRPFAAQNPHAGYPQIGGTWTGANSLTYLLIQSGNSVTVQEMSPVYGTTAFGQGIINGRHLNASYRTVLETEGTASLDLSDDGRQLTGTFTDSYSGASTPAVLQR